MARTLVAQHEDDADEMGRYYGAEIFNDGHDNFHMVIHIRTYEGMKVASSWHSERINLDAVAQNGARREARQRLDKFKAALNGRHPTLTKVSAS